MEGTLAGKIRKVFLDHPDENLQVQFIAEELDMIADAEKQILYRAIKDFYKRDEIKRISVGVYRYKGLGKKPELRQIMWAALRSKKTVTVDYLIEMSKAKEDYVREWLRFLKRRKIIKKNSNSSYTLINDSVRMPVNNEKAEKCRRIRQKKKKALEAIDEILKTALDARMAVAEMDDE